MNGRDERQRENMKVIRKISVVAMLALTPWLALAADPAAPAKKVKGAPIVPLTAPLGVAR